MPHTLLRLAFLLALPLAAQANDFPTVDRVLYVQECMAAHPDAVRALQAVAEAVAADLPVHGLAAVHRTGLLAVGDVAVVVAASAAHRGQAFEAARRLIDDLKASVPVWKRQVFDDGEQEWVGTP